MIKYVELTAPEASAFRQAKILSVECREGDQIEEGQTLFRVKSAGAEIDLPATKNGRVIEIIASAQENITLTTPLLLLETHVSGSTASKPIVAPEPTQNNEALEQHKPALPTALEPIAKTDNSSKKTNTRRTKKHIQQSLNLAESTAQEVILDKVVEPNFELNQKIATTVSSNLKPAESNTMPKNANIEISVPDIGTDSAKVIEILVSVGDTIAEEDPIITLESDKASMDVPSTHAGVVKSIAVSLDQDIGEGTVILELEANNAADATSDKADKQPTKEADSDPVPEKNHTEGEKQEGTSEKDNQSSDSQLVEVRIPDIGGDAAKVIEILVEVGQSIELEDSLITLESDKASMDVPSSSAGIIESIELSIGDEVNEGALVVTLKSDKKQTSNTTSEKDSDTTKTVSNADSNPKTKQAGSTEQANNAEPTNSTQQTKHDSTQAKSYASPSIRRFARELGVDLSKVSGSGRKQRVTQDDVKAFVKSTIETQSDATTNSGSGIPPIPAQDFSKFGDIEIQPLNKIKRLTATNLHRSWVNVPHVTHSDESDISDLESFRKQLNSEYEKQGKDLKLSPLAFIVKAVVNAMQAYPQFNSSLEPGGENLILKKYFNIGIAVETPNGLVVPVLKDADKKSVAEIAREMGELAKKARDKKLSMNDMSGACFTISSLGGIGGTGFTPIVNAPEVAILGVSRSKIQPVWNGEEFKPGMILPLSLSYDHRVIDGAEAARFARHVAAVLEDVRRLTV